MATIFSELLLRTRNIDGTPQHDDWVFRQTQRGTNTSSIIVPYSTWSQLNEFRRMETKYTNL